jgi:RNA polymerase sigma factor, sigma-70 family
MIIKGDSKRARRTEPQVVSVFMENFVHLQRFLGKFFSERQDIEDVAQEAFLRAYVAEQRRHIDSPKAYLYCVAKNLALTKLEQKSRQIAYYLDDSGDYVCESGDYLDLEFEETGYADVENLELLGLYCDAVASLPKKCRQVLLLRKVHGLGHREIAERMSLSVSSVEKYLLKGILGCRAFMAKKGVVIDAKARRKKSDGGGR